MLCADSSTGQAPAGTSCPPIDGYPAGYRTFTTGKHKLVVKGLGLRKVNQIVVRPDTPVFRGMVKKVPHLLQVVE